VTDFETGFVRKIDYDYPRVTIFYTFPIQNRDGHDGGDGRGSEDWGSKRRVNAFSLGCFDFSDTNRLIRA
jgi:hypothetical protein